MTPFVTIMADPPWPYDDQLTMSATRRGAASNYPTMSVQDICDLYTPSSAPARGPRRPGTLAGHAIADTAVLALWATKDVLLEGIHTRVCNAWGFTPKQIVPWVKGRCVGDRLILQTGMGRLTRNVVEYLILATRGKYSTLVKSRSENGLIVQLEDTILLAPRQSHSTKPEAAYALIERLLPGPYLELFARRPRANWTVWGNEVAGNGAKATTPVEPPLPLEIPESWKPFVRAHPEPPIEWP